MVCLLVHFLDKTKMSNIFIYLSFLLSPCTMIVMRFHLVSSFILANFNLYRNQIASLALQWFV